MSNYNYPANPTDTAKIDSKKYNATCLGENQHGSIHLHTEYGNSNSDIRIAFLIGMHPLESKSHRALFDIIKSEDENLNYNYFIYNIDVTMPIDEDNDEGRMDGQLLAQEFVAPHIIKEKYDLFIDVHSNRGMRGPGDYQKTNFLFAPGFDEKSEYYLNKILSKWDDMEYYAPEHRTSPEYITVPTAESGIATIVYETYTYEDMEKTLENARKLVTIVDNLDF